MGAYNTVVGSVTCPWCGQRVEVSAQFKYGDTWLLSYRVMDELGWGATTSAGPA